MFLRIFKSNQPILVFVIPLVAVALWLPNLLNPENISLESETTMPLSKGLVDFFSNKLLFYHILAIIINVINAFLISRINNQYILISDRTYLPAFIYLFLSAFIINSASSLLLLLNILLLLIILFRVFQIRSERNLLNVYFESGFLLGLGTLLYFNFWIFIFIIWIALIFLRSFYWREYFMVVLGLLAVYFFIAAFYILSNNMEALQQYYLNNMIVQSKYILSLKHTIFYSTIGFIFFLSIISLNMNLIKKKVNTRKHYKILLWLCFVPLIAYFTLPNITKDIFFFSALPLSFIFANFYVDIKNKWAREFLFIVLLLGISALYIPLL